MKPQPGQIVEVHSLQSAAGQKLNGKRGLVIRSVEEGYRYEIRLEHATPLGGTNSIKPTNLKALPKLPLPDGSTRGGAPRGLVHDIDHEMPRILCELLVMNRGDYEVPPTVMSGFAALAMSQFDRFSLNTFSANEMEWFSCLFALVNFIKQGPKGACEDIVFALLEGDPMYMDVFILSMTFTPFIGDSDETNQQFRTQYNNPRQQLTPDQWQSPQYNAAMISGPITVLHSILCHKKISSKAIMGAFIPYIQSSPVYPLLIQRLLRFVAKENEITGNLGELSRDIMFVLCQDVMSEQLQGMFQKGPLFTSEQKDMADALYSRTSYFDAKLTMKAMFMKAFSEISYGLIM